MTPRSPSSSRSSASCEGVFNVAGPQALPLSELIRVTGRSPTRIAEVLHPLLLGRFGLPRLSAGAVAHIKYPIVISDKSFRQATGFSPRHGEYETLAAFAAVNPVRREDGAARGANIDCDPRVA